MSIVCIAGLFGNNQPSPNPHPTAISGENLKMPSYTVFKADRQLVVGGSNLAQKQLDLANAFRAETGIHCQVSCEPRDCRCIR